VITDDLDVLKGAKELDPEIMVIVSTASYGVAFAIKAFHLDAYGYIMKPFDLVELWNRVSRLHGNILTEKECGAE
jgi:DNA-binding NtrC family response regulator